VNEERNEALGLVVAFPREDDLMTILRTKPAKSSRVTEDAENIERYGFR
jgi:dsDNA-binding SOS-regulon protein